MTPKWYRMAEGGNLPVGQVTSPLAFRAHRQEDTAGCPVAR